MIELALFAVTAALALGWMLAPLLRGGTSASEAVPDDAPASGARCGACGTVAPDGARFCAACGRPINDAL